MVAVDIRLHSEASTAGAMTRASDLMREVVADPDAVAQLLLTAAALFATVACAACEWPIYM